MNLHYFFQLFLFYIWIGSIKSFNETTGLIQQNHYHKINKRQVIANLCNYNQCKYGTCEVTSLTSYQCHCVTGITGTNCDTRSLSQSPCSSNPCFGNNSTCLGLSTTNFQCICATGLVGPLCQSSYSCQCQNNGVCQSSLGINNTTIYTCSCPSGYGGLFCQYPIANFQSCQTVGCSNGGTCTILSTCICPPFFTGTLCQTSTLTTTTRVTVPRLNICTDGICQNGGTCFQLTNSLATCVCTNGFSGIYCNISPQNVFCASSPCLNGGTCVPTDLVNGNCLCSPLYTGLFCNVGLTCNPNPCLNNAPCIAVNGNATCFCTGNQQPPFCS